jgi:hypothetical protein
MAFYFNNNSNNNNNNNNNNTINMENNFACTVNCNYWIAATIYTMGKWFVSGI